ncbi:MAG: TfoX/Sxy family protein [Ignavibacteriae bacterium]|nr:TfoX/Sxy family protein [Ignavibacteriota bacterium]
MAFDEKLAERIRKQLAKQKGVVEKQMFGGIAFLLNGNMCVGVHKQEMIVRIDPEETDNALAEKHTRIFDITGKPMRGWILVKPAGLATDATLGKWVRQGVAFASSLPKKKK